jgi:hypothetical protein
VITLANGSAGRQGTITIRQDSTGRTITFAASGRTVYYAGGLIPVTASARIACGYLFVGTSELWIFPSVVS